MPGLLNIGPRFLPQRRARALFSFFSAAQPGEDAQVLEGRGITLNLRAGSDLFEQPAHNLARARFRQRISKPDVIGFGNGTDFLADVLAQFLAQAAIGGYSPLESYESNEGLTFERIGPANNSSL